MFAEQRFLGAGAEFIQVITQAEDNFLGVQGLSGIECRAMLAASAALDAGERLERHQLRQILAGVEAKVVVAREWRNMGKSAAREKYGHRAQHQVQVLGVGNQRKENEQRQC